MVMFWCSLLGTVPSELLEKGQAIAEAYRIPSNQNNNETKSDDLDPELKQLEALLWIMPFHIGCVFAIMLRSWTYNFTKPVQKKYGKTTFVAIT